MAPGFNWEANGLDRDGFEALAKLLRLRYHGQIEAPIRFDELQLNDAAEVEAIYHSNNDDADSAKALTITNFGTSDLQRAFLDRLAELVSNEKGGRHVAATLLVTNHGGPSVFVAKNSKFRQKDQEFLRKTETLMRLIAENNG